MTQNTISMFYKKIAVQNVIYMGMVIYQGWGARTGARAGELVLDSSGAGASG